MAGEQPQPKDMIEELRAKFTGLQPYDDRALQLYQAFSYYVAARAEGMPQPQAAELTCSNFGHDAPRGLCLRCSLGTDQGDDIERARKRERDRLAERDRWLEGRANRS